jgi:ferric-dicitrate binding protein FerR (iron transport regulator)
VSGIQIQSESDREWLAFRYIAGDLTGAESALFEAELETNQLAREAVAHAVELSQLIAFAEPHQVERVESATRRASRKSRFYGIGWIGAGAAAASVAVAVWWNTPGPTTGTLELAEIWTEARAIEPAQGTADESTESETVLEVESDGAPSWMTAGVISLGGGKVMNDSDGDGKPDESWDDEVMEN